MNYVVGRIVNWVDKASLRVDLVISFPLIGLHFKEIKSVFTTWHATLLCRQRAFDLDIKLKS